MFYIRYAYQYALYTVSCTVRSIYYLLYSTLYMYAVQYVLHILYVVQYVHYIKLSVVQYAVYTVWCVVVSLYCMLHVSVCSRGASTWGCGVVVSRLFCIQ